ncbi:MAG: hypothetical protein KAS53_07220 [Candidatus Cloacimonetes bacterium]|nr:hypothetical protein [Candidatus Cloacimonadota bacterium]
MERRRRERRGMRNSTWVNFIIRILALVFVVMIIRYFSDSNSDKFRSWITSTKTDSVQVQENK